MSEPEEVIIDAAHVASEQVVGLWRARAAELEDRELSLDQIKRRLTLFLQATMRLDAPIVAAQPPRIPNVLVRWFRDTPKFTFRESAIPSTDGVRIRLPRTIRWPAESDREEAAERYRLYAVEQAGRIRRGTVPIVPEATRDPVRYLFELAEAAAVDRAICEHFGGLVDRLVSERIRARERRPDLQQMTVAEQRLERMTRSLLETPPDTLPDGLPASASASARESLAWAERQVDELDLPGAFRGLPRTDLWGEIEREHGPTSSTDHRTVGDGGSDRQRTREVERRPRAREGSKDEEDDGTGSWFMPRDDLHETAQDPMGLQRPVDKGDDVDPEELAESLAEMPEGRLVRTDDPARETLASDDPPPRSFTSPESDEIEGIHYPEWNCETGEYVTDKVVVRLEEPELGSRGWAERYLRDRSALVHEVRRCFEQLRPRRERLRRQPEGPELDVAAYVEAYGDRAAGCAVDDRLYQSIRPGRRDVGIHLLIDVSASTDSWIRGQKRIIDIEKEALLIVCEALEALGDDYAVSAFSGRGPRGVNLWTLKDFGEAYRTTVRRRIGGLHPDSYTRSGAAIRHATARLTEQSVRHPLLLVLSDGKPNDVDVYEGTYGIEDTRQAVREARMQGVETFCLTIDRKAPTYMDRIFGEPHYTVLHQPEILPRVLVRVVKRLLDR